MGRKARAKRTRMQPVAAPVRAVAAERPGRRRVAWGAAAVPLLLALLAVAAYANSVRVPFLLDDFRLIVDDPAVKPPVSAGTLLATERPVVTASLALNHALGGLDVVGYHVLNLVLHVCCGLLVYGFTRWTLLRPPLAARFGPCAGPLAAVTAAIFLLHPIQTESVTYVIQRAEILAAIALLGGLWLAAAAAGARHPRPYLAALVALGLLGIFSKAIVLALPLLFAVYDWCLVAQGSVRAMVRRWPIYLTLIVVDCLGVLWAVSHPARAAGFAMQQMTPWRYLRSQPGVLLYYVRLVVVPDRLCFDCGELGPWPVVHSALGERVWPPALVLVAGVVAAALARRPAPLAACAPLAALTVLLPTSVFPLGDAYFEHRLYLPIAFLAMLAVGAAFGAGEATVQRGWLPQRAARALGAATALGVVAALGALTVARNAVFAEPFRLWQDTVAKAPEAARAHNALGIEYRERGQSELAIAHFGESVRRDPNLRVFVNLGAECEKLGRYPDAVAAYEAARGRNPDVALVQHNLARTYPHTGRLEDAVRAAERAVALAPDNAAYRRTLADLRRRAAVAPGEP